METPPQQVGGVDPGLAALIAALLSGGVSAYGFSKTSDNDRAELRTAIEENLKREVGERLREEANAEVSRKEEEIRRLQGELNQLKASTEAANAAAKVDAEASSDVNQTFRNANPEVLLAAIPILLSKLATRYPKIKEDGSATPTFKSALEYPASYSGRLMRITLADFYRKRIEPSLRIDINRPATGGRRKRRAKRGGDMEAELAAVEQDTAQPVPTTAAVPGSAASYGSEYPNYEEFAPLYAEAIKEAAQQLASKGIAEKETKKQTAEQKKKDAIAKKAAEAIIAKFDKAIKAAEKALDVNVPEEQKDMVRDSRVKLSETLDKVRELVGMAPPVKKRFGLFGGASNLREVATEAEWNELNSPQKADDLLKELEDATKTYEDAVKALPEPAVEETAKEPSAPAVDEVTPSSDAISRQTSTSEPGSTTSIDKEISVLNPMFLKERKDMARKEQEEELFSELPTLPRIKKTRRTDFGGPTVRTGKGRRSRKRTLKKRRGGK